MILTIKKKIQISELRFKAAHQVFPDHPEIVDCFRDTEVVSEYEDDENGGLPVRKIPQWKSDRFASLGRLLDEVAVLSSRTLVEKRRIGRLTKRTSELGFYRQETLKIPRGLPIDAFKESFLNSLPPLAKETLAVSSTPIFGQDLLLKLEGLLGRGVHHF